MSRFGLPGPSPRGMEDWPASAVGTWRLESLLQALPEPKVSFHRLSFCWSPLSRAASLGFTLPDSDCDAHQAEVSGGCRKASSLVLLKALMHSDLPLCWPLLRRQKHLAVQGDSNCSGLEQC